jgi:hypothetical protein
MLSNGRTWQSLDGWYPIAAKAWNLATKINANKHGNLYDLNKNRRNVTSTYDKCKQQMYKQCPMQWLYLKSKSVRQVLNKQIPRFFFTNIFIQKQQTLISLQYDNQPWQVLQPYIPIWTRSALHTYSYGPAFMIPLQVLLDVLKGKQYLVSNEMHFWEILQYLDWLPMRLVTLNQMKFKST